MTKRNWSTTIYSEEELLSDFATSNWLKKQIEETKKADPLDRLRDTELLLSILEQRCIDNGCIHVQGV